MQDISFSVVIPTYNSSATIERCLKSVINQKVQPNQIIVIDDSSTDETLAIIERVLSGCGIEYICKVNEINSGPGYSRNHAMDYAISEYVAFLDSDDVYSNDKLEVIKNFILLKNNKVELISHNINSKKINIDDELKLNFKNSTLGRCLLMTTSSVVIKNSKKYRFPNRRYCEDSFLWLSIILNGKNNCYFINKSLVSSINERDFSRGLSSNLFLMYKGVVENYNYFYKKHEINTVSYVSAMAFAFLSFVLRVVKYRFFR